MKRIPLTRGKIVLVDDEDFEWLSQWKWYFDGIGYAARNVTKKPKHITIRMHRQILNAPKNLFCDHINHNGLDNRRCNLRLCTNSQNVQNRNITKGKKYKGINWHKNAWRATIRYNCKYIHIGRFDTEIKAAKAYDAKAKELFGEFARPNFPDGG